MELRDKVVVVTGAARGVDRSIALALAREGARGWPWSCVRSQS
jgi:NAD(P)-dependent dehydrogenase (short-subunit alcohol dehydrogenase family)